MHLEPGILKPRLPKNPAVATVLQPLRIDKSICKLTFILVFIGKLTERTTSKLPAANLNGHPSSPPVRNLV
jgi:hypothetical protein